MSLDSRTLSVLYVRDEVYLRLASECRMRGSKLALYCRGKLAGVTITAIEAPFVV